MKPEARIRIACRKVAAQLGFHVWDLEQGYRAGRGGARVTPGMSDLVLLGKGAVVFVEVKAGRGKQNLAQRAFEHACKRNGVPYLLVYGANDLVDGLTALGLVRVTR